MVKKRFLSPKIRAATGRVVVMIAALIPLSAMIAAPPAGTAVAAAALDRETALNEQLERARPALEAEVLQKLGWKPEVYRLDPLSYDAEKGMLVVAVADLEGLRNPLPGGGKSWRADFDVRTRKVVRWLKYQ